MLREPRYSQSLERGLAILERFSPERPVLGISELAEELGMSRSTTHRYVITLVALGYLEQVRQRKYRIRLKVADLGMSALNSTSLSEHARPFMQELSLRCRYAVAIAVLDGPEILYLESAPVHRRGQHPLAVEPTAGSRLPVHCTAIGKLLAAHLPEREQRALLADLKLDRHGPKTITSKRALRAELHRIVDGSLASGEDELAGGQYEIAAPVRSEAHEVLAALSMSAHSSMISLGQLVERLGPHLVSTADRLSARLGYRRADELVGAEIVANRFG
jgi:IclR family pca regulon transcriptional regulator